MNQTIKGDIWLTYNDEKILVKTKNKRYQIKDENTIRALTNILPEIKQKTISTRHIVTKEHPQLYGFINKFISPIQPTQQLENPTYEFINFLETHEINNSRLLSILSKLNQHKRLVAVIPVKTVPYIFIGTVAEILGFIMENRLIVSRGNTTIHEPMNLQKSIQYCFREELNADKLSVYYMNDHEPERFTKVHIFYDKRGTVGECKEKEAFDFEPIEFYHEPINAMKKIIKQTPYIFLEYGYSHLKQIPFKVAMLTYVNDEKERTAITSADHPLKALFDVFKYGMGDFLNLDNNGDSRNFTRWVCVSNEEDVYKNGILPLVFQYYKKCLPDQLEQSCQILTDFDINSKMINTLLSIHETDLLTKNIEVAVLKMKDFRLFQVQVIVDGYIQTTQFGTNIKLLLEDTIQQFYAKIIQNSFPYEQTNKKVDEHKEKKWIDLFSEEVTSSIEEMKSVLEKNRLTVTYSPWKYNYILTETKTKCFKIALSRKEHK
ncbi:hypothetical protein [Bacillus kwashiorkori]|uniref:hypothetical protein n=1 Tax=Bacillus kwashiorkori TaxID=1522318 RepID=UPI0007864F5F|nr:hypothetical protein [Bacillus kwashiorkori]